MCVYDDRLVSCGVSAGVLVFMFPVTAVIAVCLFTVRVHSWLKTRLTFPQDECDACMWKTRCHDVLGGLPRCCYATVSGCQGVAIQLWVVARVLLYNCEWLQGCCYEDVGGCQGVAMKLWVIAKGLLSRGGWLTCQGVAMQLWVVAKVLLCSCEWLPGCLYAAVVGVAMKL